MLDLQAQSTKVFPGTTTTNTIMIPPRLTRAQQVTTAEPSRTTVRPPGAGLLTYGDTTRFRLTDAAFSGRQLMSHPMRTARNGSTSCATH